MKITGSVFMSLIDVTVLGALKKVRRNFQPIGQELFAQRSLS
jgi:hypothetical protein